MSTLKKLSLTSLFFIVHDTRSLSTYSLSWILPGRAWMSIFLLSSPWISVRLFDLKAKSPVASWIFSLSALLSNTEYQIHVWRLWDLSFSFVISASLSICSVLWNNSCASSYQSTARDLNKVPAHCHPATGAQQRFKWSPKLNPCPTA